MPRSLCISSNAPKRRERSRARNSHSRAAGAPRRTVGISLCALGLIEGGQAGDPLLREALADSPARLEHARALVDLGALLRRGNSSRTEARKLLREGIELAHRCGAVALVQRAIDELAATGAHPRTILLSGADALTASERRVAHMAAEDLSNKEIAQALFVTVKPSSSTSAAPTASLTSAPVDSSTQRSEPDPGKARSKDRGCEWGRPRRDRRGRGRMIGV